MIGFLGAIGRFIGMSLVASWVLAEVFLFVPSAQPVWQSIQATLRLPTHNEWNLAWGSHERQRFSRNFKNSVYDFVDSVDHFPGVRFDTAETVSSYEEGFKPINRQIEFAASDYRWFSQ